MARTLEVEVEEYDLVVAIRRLKEAHEAFVAADLELTRASNSYQQLVDALVPDVPNAHERMERVAR